MRKRKATVTAAEETPRARAGEHIEAPEVVPEVPEIDDLVRWLVDEAAPPGRVRQELRKRGLPEDMVRGMVRDARRLIRQLAQPVPIEIQRARLQVLIARAAKDGNTREYRTLAAELRQLDRARLKLPTDLTPESQRAYVLSVMELRNTGVLTAEEAREALAPLATLAQVSYAEAAQTGVSKPAPEVDEGELPKSDAEATDRVLALVGRGKS